MKTNFKRKVLAIILMATMVFSTSGLAFANENDIEKNVPETGKATQQTTTNGSSESQEAVQNEEANQAAEAIAESFIDNGNAGQRSISRAAVTEETEYVAQIGSQKYETLQGAIDAAKDGDTITVLTDIYNEFVNIQPGENVKLTIDFNEHGIIAEDYEDVIYINTGNITILDAFVINMNETGETNACICISDANATFENCYLDTFSDGSRGYYISGNSNVSLNECAFIDIEIISNGEIIKDYTPLNVEGCYVDENATLTANDCYIWVCNGKGIYSCGTTNINNSFIVSYDENFPDQDSCAIASAEGGTVNINNGYYQGKPALHIYDADSFATIKKGEFVSNVENRPAIDYFPDKNSFGTNVTIASGSMSSPSESYWKTNGSENINVYKKLAAPSSAKAKLSKYNAAAFSWSKVSGAEAYKVYYKKSSAKSYTYLTTTTKTSVTKTGLSSGVKYDFRVYPCDLLDSGGDKIYCQSSNYKAASVYTLKKLSTPKVSKKSKSSVTVKWTNISGEAGYQISKSTKKSGTNIVSTYKTTSGKSKVIKAKKGKTYYYKVRAYAYDSKGNKVYGPWSSVKSYKLK